MSFLKNLFAKSRLSQAKGEGIERHMEHLNTLRLPAIALLAAKGARLSRIGGLPSLPDDMPWPEWKGKPLAFLCQINLAEIPNDCDRNGLPPSGMLYFFYNQKQETAGFDPKDEGSWRVVYAASPPKNGAKRTPPDGLNNDYVYAEKPIALSAFKTYPDWQDERVQALNFNDDQENQYAKLCTSVFKGNPAHHLFGHPSPVQGNDMDLECQLVSHGLYCGDTSGYQSPRAKEVEAGRHDWILLLQLDTDDDAKMMWGDCGMLYFWIRKQDLKEGRFDRCWMILQCS